MQLTGYPHLATEATVDLVNRRIADHNLITPDSNRDAFTVLEEAGKTGGALVPRGVATMADAKHGSEAHRHEGAPQQQGRTQACSP